MKVLLGMPSYSGWFPAIMVQSIVHLQKPCPVGFMTVDRLPIVQARNLMARHAIENEYDYLLFVDDDNPIPRDTLVKLIEDDKDIVSPPIPHRNMDGNGERKLCVFREYEERGMRLYKPIESFPDNGYLHRVDACGMGCTLIKTEVLKAVNEKYPDRPFQLGNLIEYKDGDKILDANKGLKRTMSEDLEFSERARDAGFEIWCDTRIRPLHLTTMGYTQWSPMTENVNTGEYWDKVWAREGGETWRQYPMTFEKIKMAVKPDDEVLDVGCGVGVLLDILKPTCRKVAGLDISPKAIEVLKSKGIEGKVGTLPKIGYPDKSFDVVVSTETLEHMDNPGPLIQEMMRVARRMVIVSVPDDCLGADEEKEHRQKFTETSLKELLSKYSSAVGVISFKDTFTTPNVNISLPTLLAVCSPQETVSQIPTVECNPDMLGVSVAG